MNETYVLYGIVFVAVCLPILLWRHDTAASLELPVGEWRRLPGVFKLLWRPAYLLETSLGEACRMMLPRMSRRYIELIEISNLPLTSRRVFVCKVILAAVFAGLGSLIHFVPGVPDLIANVVTVGMPVLGWFLPSLSLAGVAQKRQEEIVRALPFAIDLMGSAMRAGLEFGAALRYYAGLGDGGALAEEFARVARDTTLGKPIAEGLQDMAARLRIKTFTSFAGVIAYGTEIGASISDTLKVHGAEMRRERFSLAEQKAARAPSVMIIPLAVFILPAVFLIIFVPVLLQFIATKGS